METVATVAQVGEPPRFELEPEYQRTIERLRKKPSRALAALLLIGSLVAFLVVQQSQSGTLVNVGILAGVLLLHEAGHWAGMRLLGWRDLKMFFIPFFGAAVSGRRAGAASWKEGVVVLLGPMPGIVLGAMLALAVRTDGSAALRTAVFMLLVVNAFNLLPLAVLDGGKLLQLTLFQRHRNLEVAFLVAASAGLLGASVWLDDVALRYVGIGTLVSLPLRHKLLRSAQALRERGLSVPGDARELDGETGREVFLQAWNALPEKRRRPAQLAAIIENLIDLVSRTVPTASQTAALLTVWALGLGAAGGGVWLLKHSPMAWREVRGPGGRYSVQLPGEPKVSTSEQSGSGPSSQQLTFERGDYAFIVVDTQIPPGMEVDLESWRRGAVPAIAKSMDARVNRSVSKEFLGNPGFEALMAGKGRDIKFVGFVHAGYRYILVASVPAGDRALGRFFDSVSILRP
jgi:Zn-dependent protease